MILEPPKIKSDTVSTVSPSISHEVMETKVDVSKNHTHSENSEGQGSLVYCNPWGHKELAMTEQLKEESEKAGLKLNIQKKLRSWHPVPSLHDK